MSRAPSSSDRSEADSQIRPLPGMSRWMILAGYGLLAASTQLLWLTFAPITTQTARVMHVSSGATGDLAIIFPFVYIVLGLPTGRWLDGSFKRALTTGALLTAAGALIRLAAPDSFAVQLSGQVVIAAGQPLVLNAITKVAGQHFPRGERATAISVGSVSLFLGILVAMLTGGPLFDAGGLRLLLAVQAVPAVIAAVWMLMALRTPATYPDNPSTSIALGWLRRDRFMWVLAGLLFVGMGIYNAVATWLETILNHFHEGSSAGNLVALMTFAGILGAAILPPVIAAKNRRRAMLSAATGLTALCFLVIAARHGLAWIAVFLFVEGFVLMTSLPVTLDWSELHAGPERQGGAVGFLMLAGNLGGVVLALTTQALMGRPDVALLALAVAGCLGLALTTRLPARVSEPSEAKRE
ncbi:MAG: MFS transporter [Acidimicrobiales bacterium]